MVYGSKAYTVYESAVLKLAAKVVKENYPKNWESLFAIYPSLTAKEFSELSGLARNKTEQVLNDLVAAGHLERSTTKNGSMWSIKK